MDSNVHMLVLYHTIMLPLLLGRIYLDGEELERTHSSQAIKIGKWSLC